MRTHALLALAAGLLTARPALADGDLDKLQGTWALVAAVRDGRDAPDDQVRRTTLLITGRTFSFPREATLGTGPSGTFTLDPAGTPKAIDVTPDAGPHKGQTWLGIYEVDGDLYQACFAPPGRGRPTGYASDPGSGRLHSIWRRAMPAGTSSADPDRFQGTWAIDSVTVDGERIDDAQIRASKVAVRGDRYTVTGDVQTITATFTLDPTRTPKAIDITYRDEAESRTFQGIYKLEGDTFAMCRPRLPEGGRPTGFAAPKGSGLVLVVLKRQKP
jgi:uncharacterized protein (TIGR03067 family)